MKVKVYFALQAILITLVNEKPREGHIWPKAINFDDKTLDAHSD